MPDTMVDSTDEKDGLRQRKPQEDDDEDMPEDVRKVKEKLEAKTGKKYRYRPAEKDLPGVRELLKLSVTEGPKTWKETIGYPVALALIFALSLFVFHHAVLTKPSPRARGKMNLNSRRTPLTMQQPQRTSMQDQKKPEEQGPLS
jgi:hypothetical protein